MNLPPKTNAVLPTILLVEDDDVDIRLMKREIQRQSLPNPLVVAKDGAEALQILRRESATDDAGRLKRPYMILLDLNMPGMGGIEFLANLRSDEQLHQAVVFVLSSSDAPADRDAAYRHHVAGYLVKGAGRDGAAGGCQLIQSFSKHVRLPTEREPSLCLN